MASRLSPLAVPGSPAAAASAAPPWCRKPEPAAGTTPGSTRPRFKVFEAGAGGGADGVPPPPANLHEAAERGDTPWCLRVIERTLDFDINCRDRLQRTALHWAAEEGRLDTVSTLLDYGADVHATDCTGRTALHLAAKTGGPGVLEALTAALSKDAVAALVNAGDNNNLTAAFLAAQRGDEGQEAFLWLLQHGAHYNEPAEGAKEG